MHTRAVAQPWLLTSSESSTARDDPPCHRTGTPSNYDPSHGRIQRRPSAPPKTYERMRNIPDVDYLPESSPLLQSHRALRPEYACARVFDPSCRSFTFASSRNRMLVLDSSRTRPFPLPRPVLSGTKTYSRYMSPLTASWLSHEPTPSRLSRGRRKVRTMSSGAVQGWGVCRSAVGALRPEILPS